MRFIKDLLFFEINTTGPDAEKDQVIQLSAVLLDKDNLLEKSFFSTYIRVTYLDSVLHHHAQTLFIDYNELKKSPKPVDAIRAFNKHFESGQLVLATHGTQNVMFLKNAFKKTLIPFEFNYHVLDLWTLGYIYTLNYGIKKMPSFQTFLEQFKLKQKHPADALEKVRLEAEVFRRLIKEA